MSEIQINSVKLISQKVKKEIKVVAEISYRKTLKDGSHRHCEEVGDAEVHLDFKNAMQKLSPHLAIIAEFIDAEEVQNVDDDPGLSSEFFVTSYSIGGKEDNPGIVITGHKTLSTGKALGLNTPFTRFDEKEETAYVLMDKLINQIGFIEDEAKAYLKGEKKAAELQTKMELNV